jgi:Tol biopolymer transport system component
MDDLERGTLSKRTFEDNNSFPIWSRDGLFLTFTRGPGLFGPLVRLRADGTGQSETLVAHEAFAALNVATSWSPDGRVLVFQSGQNIMVRDADGTVRPLLATAPYECEGRFAPDGRWFAYRSDETGRDEVYVRSFPPGNGKWQISPDGGAQPMWSSDGKELFYKTATR